MDNKKMTFTKIIVVVYSILFAAWVTLSYALAFMGRYEIAEELSSNVVIVGIAAILGYMLKAFFETRELEKNKITRETFGLNLEEKENYEYNEDDLFNDEEENEDIIEGDDGNE